MPGQGASTEFAAYEQDAINGGGSLPSSMSDVDTIAYILGRARSVVVITGAGISAESGIRTFRDTMEGLWKDFDPQKLATPEAFAADPTTVTRWYDWRRRGCLAAEPNPGHIAIADMERHITGRGGRFTLLTQNVDRLHQRAGSRNVVELHGNIMTWRCTRTAREIEPGPGEFEHIPMPSPFDQTALLRPCVVWFGEMLPEAALNAAYDAVESCDIFFTIGTSSIVYPAAGFVQIAAQRNATTVEINRESTPATGLVDHSAIGRAGELLPQIIERAFARG
jgi:NAD-dependent deacetylase